MVQDKCKEKITINSIEVSPDILSTIVTRRESSIDDVTFIANDEAGKIYLATLNLGDEVKIEYKWEDGDNIWYVVFGGNIVDLNPNMSKAGEICSATAYGFGAPLKNMRIATELGAESVNLTVDTIGKAYNHMITNYVNKLLGDRIGDPVVDSGYFLQLYYANSVMTDPLNYILFKWQDCFSALQDLIKLAGSSRYVADPSDWAGLHWIVLPYTIEGDGGPRILVAPIGDHESVDGEIHGTGSMEDVWATNAFVYPIEVKSDMITHGFQHQIFEANFIAVSGRFVFPQNEYFTEGHADEWYSDDVGAHIHDEDTIKMIGAKSVFLHANTGYYHGEFWFDVPWMDMTKIGTKDAMPKIDFWVYNVNGEMEVRLWTTSGDKFSASITSQLETNKWVHITLDIDGPFIDGESTIWEKVGTPDWSQITNIGFTLHGAVLGLEAYIDGLQIIGAVVACAYDSTHIAAHGVKILTVKDSLTELHTLDTESVDYDKCQLALTALGELNRNRVDVLTGQILIPLSPTVKAGQIVHIHASQLPDESFQIDQDFRITEVRHTFTTQGALTQLSLTDDLKNSVPRTNASSDAYSQLIAAMNPDSQTRTFLSLKTGGDFDPKLTIVAKDYPT